MSQVSFESNITMLRLDPLDGINEDAKSLLSFGSKIYCVVNSLIH